MEEMQICRICKRKKALKLGFYKSKTYISGYESRCKECHSAICAVRSRKNYDKEHWRKKAIKRRISGKSKLNAQEMMKKYPEKHKARYMLRNAVRAGKVKKLPCKVCRAVKVEGHHDDYSKPLKVIWLCQKHHKERHRRHKELLALINTK